MKWMIVSDIHGSAHYCKKMLEAYKREKADRLLLLGDILYHGPRNDLPDGYAPKEVIAMLNEISESILCVRGNCDGEVDDMVLDFSVLADYALISEESLGGRMIYATHGHRYNISCLPKLKPGDILMHGHTHIPCFEESNGIMIINPGSVSIPKNGSSNSYIILNDGQFSLKDLEGNIIMTKDVSK